MGVLRGGDLLHEACLPPPSGGRPLHATALLGEVERAANAVGGWEEVDMIAVGTGPGSFTGIRIGIATARALSSALGLPARGVGTLDALGQGGSEASTGHRVAAMIDGRRGEVFAALYDTEGRRETEPEVGKPGAVAERLTRTGSGIVAVGSGALRFAGELADCGIEIPGPEDPRHRVAGSRVCAIAARGGGAEDLSPQYLRAPDAERWHERADLQRSGG